MVPPGSVDPAHFLDSLITRRVTFRYSGEELRYDLTTALFSSAGVDSGTTALLRALRGPLADLKPGHILDVGCGTGTLGITLAATTGVQLQATDRDALAAWFTEHNARLNDLPATDAAVALGVPALGDDDRRADTELAVCNLPAKAGEPVLRQLTVDLCSRVAPKGIAGVVIVAPLAGFLRDQLDRIGSRIVSQHETGGHLAVVCSPEEDAKASENVGTDSLPTEYVRAKHSFTGPRASYQLTTAHNLAEFDSLGYGTELAFRLMRRQTPSGRIFLWGSGQGHLAVGLAAVSHRREFVIADRDLLAITVTARNLNMNDSGIRVFPLISPGIGVAASTCDHRSFDWMIVQSHPEPGSRWAEELCWAAERLLDTGGRLLVVSRSTSLSRLAPLARRSFSQFASQRHHGYRADLLVRKR